jgi:(E)-4-hydroxy-3-methylbut-2-enyl-diphosphate synthase
VDALFAEIDRSLDRGRVHVDEAESQEGADWLAKIEEENADELTPERIAQMEKAETPTESERVLGEGDGEGPELEEGEPYLKPVKVKRTELDEKASPTAGRRFTRA